MRIGLVSRDEVNRDLARRMIPEEMELECCDMDGGLRGAINGGLRGECGSPGPRIDAWIYDLDQLAPEDRNLILRMLPRAVLRQPVAVLSYSLPGSVRRRLRASGVLVRRRLDLEVFTELDRMLRATERATLTSGTA